MWLWAIFPKQPDSSSHPEEGQSHQHKPPSIYAAQRRKVTTGNETLQAITILIAMLYLCDTWCQDALASPVTHVEFS